MLGLFSHFEGTRQGNWAGAKGARSWHHRDAHRGGDAKGMADVIQSSLVSLCSGGPRHKSPSPHTGPLDAPDSQQPAQTVLESWALCVSLEMALSPSRNWPQETSSPLTPHLSLGSGSHFCWGAGVMHSTDLHPALVGLEGRSSPPASAQGSSRPGEGLGVTWPLPSAWWRDCGPRADREVLLT